MLLASRRDFVGLLANGWAGRQSAEGRWVSMFDGSSLQGWKETPYIGRGAVTAGGGALTLNAGRTTGVTWAGEFPRSGYEIQFEASRLEGKDIFAGITFPVGSAYCSWISGGWDGETVGLSNLEGNDASENDTSTLRSFEKGRWYAFRLAVTEEHVRGWIDGGLIIDVDPRVREFSLPFGEADLAAPLGFWSYRTKAGLRKISWRGSGR
ncbi:MAG: DUF1080 domain-containing protein [Acidobacteria bacterium]|nr:DUF1080 domain-containing protein [Acidobacteriota bacterium]